MSDDNFWVQSFDEVPNGCIKLQENNNYFYIQYLLNNYVAKQQLNFATITNIDGIQVILCKNDYFNVKNGELILSVKTLYSMVDNSEISSDLACSTKIIPINYVLEDLNVINKEYITLEDVDNITNSKKYINRKNFNSKYFK